MFSIRHPVEATSYRNFRSARSQVVTGSTSNIELLPKEFETRLNIALIPTFIHGIDNKNIRRREISISPRQRQKDRVAAIRSEVTSEKPRKSKANLFQRETKNDVDSHRRNPDQSELPRLSPRAIECLSGLVIENFSIQIQPSFPSFKRNR